MKKLLSILLAVLMLFLLSVPFATAESTGTAMVGTEINEAKEYLLTMLNSSVELLTSPEINTYTPESCERLEQAVAEGYEIYYDPNAEVSVVTAQTENVKAAIFNMQKQELTDEAPYYLSTIIARAEFEVGAETGYTKESWEEFSEAYEEALYVQSNGKTDAEFINAAEKLKAAIESLVPVDTSVSDARAYLETMMDSAYRILDSGERYTAESLERLESALASANSVYHNPDATAQELELSTMNLKSAISGMRKIVISEEALNYLADMLGMANTQVGPRENYTEVSYEAFSVAYSNALQVFETGETDEEYIAAADALGSAINGLVSSDASVKTAREYLKSIMDSAHQILSGTVKYTAASRLNLETTLEQANTVYFSESATESELYNEAEKLESAINSMEEVVISKEVSDYLSAQIERANTEVLTEEAYTPESWDAFELTYAEALNVLNKSESEEEYLAAADALRIAIDSLVAFDEKQNALEELSNLIEFANDTQGNFTPESVENLRNAVKNATVVLENEEATLEEIRQQIEMLQNAIDGLLEITVPSDAKMKLETLIAAADKIKASDVYGSDTWDGFINALNNAESIYNEDRADDEYVQASDSLQTAMDRLLTEAREELEYQINSGAPVGGNYTSESYSRLINALDNAREVYNNPNAGHNEIIEQIELVEAARNGLQITPISPTAKQTLWNVIEKSQVEVGDREDYTRESWSVYSDAYSDAMGTYYYGQSDSEYYLAAQKLQSAMDGLVLKASIPEEPTPDEVYVLLGDVDADSKVTIKDATFIQKCVAGLNTLEGLGEFSADANRDGVVNIKDATEIQKYLAGLKSNENIGKEILIPAVSE